VDKRLPEPAEREGKTNLHDGVPLNSSAASNNSTQRELHDGQPDVETKD